jgi:hypothetical protein
MLMACLTVNAVEEELWTVLKERGPTEEDMFDAIDEAGNKQLSKDLNVEENFLMGCDSDYYRYRNKIF